MSTSLWLCPLHWWTSAKRINDIRIMSSKSTDITKAEASVCLLTLSVLYQKFTPTLHSLSTQKTQPRASFIENFARMVVLFRHSNKVWPLLLWLERLINKARQSWQGHMIRFRMVLSMWVTFSRKWLFPITKSYQFLILFQENCRKWVILETSKSVSMLMKIIKCTLTRFNATKLKSDLHCFTSSFCVTGT